MARDDVCSACISSLTFLLQSSVLGNHIVVFPLFPPHPRGVGVAWILLHFLPLAS
jgi:hypothetical protein